MDIIEIEEMIDRMLLVHKDYEQKQPITFHYQARKEIAERLKKEINEMN